MDMRSATLRVVIMLPCQASIWPWQVATQKYSVQGGANETVRDPDSAVNPQNAVVTRYLDSPILRPLLPIDIHGGMD
jgi:hypothetical protein